MATLIGILFIVGLIALACAPGWKVPLGIFLALAAMLGVVMLWLNRFAGEGWNPEQILRHPHTDADWRPRNEALKDVSLRPLEVAMLINGLIDAVLHWQTNGGIEPPHSIVVRSLTNEEAFWPYDFIGASL